MRESSKKRSSKNPLKKWYVRLITREFTKCYYHSRPKICKKTYWLGVPVGKCPLDLWTYQEILSEVRPDVVVECGTGWGGSALYLASCCDLIGKGRILTIDVNDLPHRPNHERVRQLLGSSVSPEVVEAVKSEIKDGETVLVVLDSVHSKEHVLNELRTYGGLVTSGSYVIVEDGIAGGHPVKKGHYPGPMEAVEEFVAEDSMFTIDREREKFMLTFNPKGYLRKR